MSAPEGINPVSLPACNCCPRAVVAVRPIAHLILAVEVSRFINTNPAVFAGAVSVITVDTVALAAEPDPAALTGALVGTALVIVVIVPELMTTAPVFTAVIFPSILESEVFPVSCFALVAAPVGRGSDAALIATV